MKFYARGKDKILIYNYDPNEDKIYGFKKRKIEMEKRPTLGKYLYRYKKDIVVV